ncbi:MAG: metallophosphoesterase [Bacteroidales bacterium]|nr:metallophosphoesterase [Bacteroidales bacterium]
MNILVLSDLHIGTRDNIGTFQWDEMDFIMHVERLREIYKIDRIIFNGDVFELLKYTFEDIAAAHPILIDYFNDKDFFFIKGNHDIVNYSGQHSFDITNSSGQKIHIEHGHDADWINGTKIGRSISKLILLFFKNMSNFKSVLKIYFRINAFLDPVNKIPKRYNTLKYLSYGLKLLKDYDVVILAHTHKLESHHTYYLHKKKRYLNSGTCSLGRLQGIVMDTETLKYDLIKENSDKKGFLFRTSSREKEISPELLSGY